MTLEELSSKPCFFEEKMIPLSDAKVSIRTHALQYGTAVIGGIRGYYNPESDNIFLFRLKDHYARLHKSCRLMQMRLKYSVEELINITLDLVKSGNWHQNVYLRPIVYKSALELSPRLHNVKDDFALYPVPLDNYLDIDNGLKVCISSWQRISDNQISPKAKATGGYMNSALAKSEAMQNNFDEAIFLDNKGNISEGSAEIVFMVYEGVIYTPDLSSSILDSITRRTVIELAASLDLKVVEKAITRADMYLADEVFFAGTGVQIAWVKSIDHRAIGDEKIGPVTRQIRDLFFSIVTGKNKEYNHWLTPVY